jgi:hypothetical protein
MEKVQLRSGNYRFVADQYVEAVNENSHARIWMLSFPGLSNPAEMIDAFLEYVPGERIEALDISATLYTKRAAEELPAGGR